MKSLGIVRRIDDLGRVVIPKEVRNTNGWDSKTPLEMFATKEGLLLREYGRDKEVKDLLKKMDQANEKLSDETLKQLIKEAREFIARG